MKRILALIFVSLLCAAVTVSAFAADYTIGSDGNAVYDSAVGHVINIDDVNGKIEGEDATVITNNDAVAGIGSKWAIWFIAENVAENVIYEVISDGAAMGGALPSVTLAPNQIMVVVHSSSSNPNDAATYPNWENKVLALAVNKGDYIVFDSTIDLASGSGSGMMLITTKDEVLAGLIEFPEADTPSVPDESIPESDNSSDISAEPEDVVSNEPVTSSDIKIDPDAPVTAVSTAVPGDGADDSSAAEEGGSWLNIGKWVILAVSVIFFVVAIVIYMKKPVKAEEPKEEPNEETKEEPEEKTEE